MRIALGQFDHGRIGAGPAHQAFAGGFAKGHAKLDTGHGIDQRFVDVFDGLDKVRLPKDEIDRFGFVDFHGDELHIKHLLSELRVVQRIDNGRATDPGQRQQQRPDQRVFGVA
ncbi:hypothetical protein D3C86_1697080 [compost metagenome]